MASDEIVPKKSPEDCRSECPDSGDKSEDQLLHVSLYASWLS
jgi:hypothetical protein